MRVKLVEYAEEPWWAQYRVWFEHNGIEWYKTYAENQSPQSLQDWINSLIEDTIVRVSTPQDYKYQNSIDKTGNTFDV